MGRLRVLSGKKVCRILSRHGFRQVRRRSSHIIMQRKEHGTTRTVPVPDHPTLKVGTLLSIIRQSGLARELFEEP